MLQPQRREVLSIPIGERGHSSRRYASSCDESRGSNNKQHGSRLPPPARQAFYSDTLVCRVLIKRREKELWIKNELVIRQALKTRAP